MGRVLLESQLSPLATPSYPAVRVREEEECSLRTPFQRDRDRRQPCATAACAAATRATGTRNGEQLT